MNSAEIASPAGTASITARGAGSCGCADLRNLFVSSMLIAAPIRDDPKKATAGRGSGAAASSMTRRAREPCPRIAVVEQQTGHNLARGEQTEAHATPVAIATEDSPTPLHVPAFRSRKLPACGSRGHKLAACGYEKTSKLKVNKHLPLARRQQESQGQDRRHGRTGHQHRDAEDRLPCIPSICPSACPRSVTARQVMTSSPPSPARP